MITSHFISPLQFEHLSFLSLFKCFGWNSSTMLGGRAALLQISCQVCFLGPLFFIMFQILANLFSLEFLVLDHHPLLLFLGSCVPALLCCTLSFSCPRLSLYFCPFCAFLFSSQDLMWPLADLEFALLLRVGLELLILFSLSPKFRTYSHVHHCAQLYGDLQRHSLMM